MRDNKPGKVPHAYIDGLRSCGVDCADFFARISYDGAYQLQADLTVTITEFKCEPFPLNQQEIDTMIRNLAFDGMGQPRLCCR